MRALRVMLAGVLLLVLSGAAVAVRPVGSEVSALFDHANEAFREGAALRDSAPRRADAKLAEAIAAYEELVGEYGITNPKLQYNLGNARLMCGEVGRAIVAYRRALSMGSSDANLRANLAYARSRVETSFDEAEPSRLYRTLLGWQDAMSVRGRLGVFVALFTLGWIAGLARLMEAGRRVAPRWVMAALLALSLLPAASLGMTAYGQSRTFGVVVAERATGHKGPDESYESSFTRPLAEGVEFELLEVRPGWVYVRLPDGRTTWLARDVIELI